jgi:hypothetical protein
MSSRAVWISLVSVSMAMSMEVDLKTKRYLNDAAYIPAQCYTKTVDAKGGVNITLILVAI